MLFKREEELKIKENFLLFCSYYQPPHHHHHHLSGWNTGASIAIYSDWCNRIYRLSAIWIFIAYLIEQRSSFFAPKRRRKRKSHYRIRPSVLIRVTFLLLRRISTCFVRFSFVLFFLPFPMKFVQSIEWIRTLFGGVLKRQKSVTPALFKRKSVWNSDVVDIPFLFDALHRVGYGLFNRRQHQWSIP